jgi:hypothetical protein
VTANAFIPEIWDAAVYRVLQDNLVAKKICRNYTGKVKGKGDQVHFNGLAPVNVAAYSGTVSYENLHAGRVTLLIDQDNYYGFDVEDLEAVMANVDLKGSQTEDAGYQLAKACDSYIMQLYSGAYSGNVCTADTSCDSDSIIQDMAALSQKLLENNVPLNNMWTVIPPWVMIKLKLAGIKFSINEGISGKGGMAWTKDLGFDVFVTNQVYTTGGVTYVMAGSYNAIVFAEALMKSETLRAETVFATHVRGRHVFGAKVIKPKELAYIALTETAESAWTST